MCAKLVQLCLTLCNPRDCSPPGSSVCGILQTRIMEWVAMSFSRGSFQLRDWPRISKSPAQTGGFFTTSATWLYLTLFWKLNSEPLGSLLSQLEDSCSKRIYIICFRGFELTPLFSFERNFLPWISQKEILPRIMVDSVLNSIPAINATESFIKPFCSVSSIPFSPKGTSLLCRPWQCGSGMQDSTIPLLAFRESTTVPSLCWAFGRPT